MSFNSSKVDVHGHAINNVEGNQVNQTISAQVVHIGTSQREIERTEYDEFEEVKRGNIVTLTRLHTANLVVQEWELVSEDGGELVQKPLRSTQRAICTVRVHPDQQRKYTAVIYKGDDAEIFWNKDFEHFSSSSLGNPEVWQLYGLNRAKIPFLIFHGELAPLRNFYNFKKQSFWGDFFILCLEKQLQCRPSQIWLNMGGHLCKGVDGPVPLLLNPLLYLPSTESSGIVIRIPSPQFLQSDNFVQYLQQFSSPQLDRAILTHASFKTSHSYHGRPPSADHTRSNLNWTRKKYPYLEYLFCHKMPDYFPLHMIGGLRFDTVYSPSCGAVACDSYSLWEYNGSGLGDKTEMGDGQIRFKLDDSSDVCIQFRQPYDFLKESWKTQSSRIIDAHDMSGTDKEQYFIFQLPLLRLESLPSRDQKPSLTHAFENPRPIYLFIHRPPMTILELISWSTKQTQTHFWSFDENGRSEMSEEERRRWEVPELVLDHLRISFLSWQANIYPALRKWQVARGFDPTTTDWARSLGYPELEIISRKIDEARFEQVHKNTLWASDLQGQPAVEQPDLLMRRLSYTLRILPIIFTPRYVKNVDRYMRDGRWRPHPLHRL